MQCFVPTNVSSTELETTVQKWLDDTSHHTYNYIVHDFLQSTYPMFNTEPCNEYILNITNRIATVTQKEKKQCSICWEYIEKNTLKTACNHYFHKTCILQWFKQNTTCPNCRCEL